MIVYEPDAQCYRSCQPVLVDRVAKIARTFTHLSKEEIYIFRKSFRIYLRKKKKKEKKVLIEVREYSVSGVRGEGASSKRCRVWGSKTGWPTMSASMRSTLQTVPESVPADHVTNSKVSTKIYGKTKILLNSCNRNCSLEDEMARRVFLKNVCEMRNFASRARSISKPQ